MKLAHECTIVCVMSIILKPLHWVRYVNYFITATKCTNKSFRNALNTCHKKQCKQKT